MRIIKQTLWFLLAGGLLWLGLQLLFRFLLYRNESVLDAIFAYSPTGRLDVAARVYLQYLTATIGLTFILILLRYPLHWLWIATLGSGLCLRLWWEVVSYPNQTALFHSAVQPLLFIIPLPIFYSSLWARRIQGKIRATPSGYIESIPRFWWLEILLLAISLALGWLIVELTTPKH